MAKKLFINLIVLVCLSLTALAQNTYTISGTIRDKKETLPGAAVYVSGYKIATVTNNDGKFSLPQLPAGSYDILVQMIGYLPYTKNVVITDKSVIIEVVLVENTTTLNEVVIRPDSNRPYYIALFRDFFIGKTENAQNCKILNTDVLSFDDDRKDQRLTITANDFLIVENKALGYRIKYLLEFFEYDYKTKIFFYGGHPHFEEMAGSKSKQKRWEKNRVRAYNGSIQHFFKSLYTNKTTEEGYMIYKLKTMPNPTRPADSLIAANIKRLLGPKIPTRPSDSLIEANVKKLTTALNGTTIAIGGNTPGKENDSLSYWIKKRNEPKQINALIAADVAVDTLVKPFNADLKMMNYADALYVIYKNEKEEENFTYTGLQQSRPPALKNYQISVVDLLAPQARFYSNGGIADPRSLLYKGYWAYEKVADMVPLDYFEVKNKE